MKANWLFALGDIKKPHSAPETAKKNAAGTLR